MSLRDKRAVVTGGSRRLGLKLVEALVAHDARVIAEALDSVRARLGVATVSADVTDVSAAHRILAELRPDILALNAGAMAPMGGLDQMRRADSTRLGSTTSRPGSIGCRQRSTSRSSREAGFSSSRVAPKKTDRLCTAAKTAPNACFGSSLHASSTRRRRLPSASSGRCSSSLSPCGGCAGESL
jgi:NAD(P)-dependent dehydrogenase (short-subunit alcohol dehydrogenase family)